ncbi:MAG: histidine phosphatase family protein [Propionicimonas sp.]|nr:histidine phosphatase family protein [Propionicimonas sp.]
MYLLLIRHGESLNNRVEAETGVGSNRVPDPELTELGIQQAARLADHFAAGALPRPDVLLSSLMYRAVATSAPIAEALDLPVEGHTLLHEVNGVYEGTFTGHSTRGVPRPGTAASVLQRANPRLVLPPQADETGWYRRPFETPGVAAERARVVLAELSGRFGTTEQVIAIVSHAWFIQYLLRAAIGWAVGPDGELGTWLEFSNTGHTLLRSVHNPDFSQVVEWTNRLDHLPADLVSR